MHIQNSVPGWLEAVPHLPPRGIVRALGSPSWLGQVKALRPDVYTSFRFYIGDGQTAEGDWETCKEHWRRIYRRWVDRTYLEQYAAHIDLVAEANEYAATTTWRDPHDKAKVLQSCRAAVDVWNNEYRGRWVTSADGGRGFIPAGCRLSILAQPVSNWIPREIFALALAEDCAIDYRAYIHCYNGEHSPFDWDGHSGLWNLMEQYHGLKPLWMFGEGGVPYFDVLAGWRTAYVLSHDEDKLEAVCRAWYRDVRGTAAFREHRILGVQGCQFNTGDPGGTWQDYELDTAQLVRLAKAAREEYAQETDDMDTPEKRKLIAQKAREIIALTGEPLVAPWWESWPEGAYPAPGRALAIPNKLITFYRADGLAFNPQPINRPVNWTMWAVERRGNMLNVFDQAGTANDWWVKAEDVQPA